MNSKRLRTLTVCALAAAGGLAMAQVPAPDPQSPPSPGVEHGNPASPLSPAEIPAPHGAGDSSMNKSESQNSQPARKKPHKSLPKPQDDSTERPDSNSAPSSPTGSGY